MDQRSVDRLDAQFATRCASVGRTAPARLLDISPHGCCVAAAEPILASGNPVRIRIAGLSSLDGKVVWHEGSRAGVEFTAILHPAVVAYIAERVEGGGLAPVPGASPSPD